MSGGPSGKRFVAEADFGVAVLELFNYVLRHRAAAGDFVEVRGHVAQDVWACHERAEGWRNFDCALYGLLPHPISAKVRSRLRR